MRLSIFLGGGHLGLEIRRINKSYQTQAGETLEALIDISFTVGTGEFVSVVGPSGCGKSTLLEICAGLRVPSQGSVTFEGRTIPDPAVEESIGIVFQEDALLPWRTVLGNVGFGVQMRGASRKEWLSAAHEMVDLVGLQGFEDAFPSELSGGMRQRVAIARTLALKPRLLLLDEPFGALDAQTRLILGDELLGLVSAQGATVMLVTHSLEEAAMLSDRAVVFSRRPGRVKTVIDGLLGGHGVQAIGSEDLSRVQGQLWSALRDELLLQDQEEHRANEGVSQREDIAGNEEIEQKVP